MARFASQMEDSSFGDITDASSRSTEARADFLEEQQQRRSRFSDRGGLALPILPVIPCMLLPTIGIGLAQLITHLGPVNGEKLDHLSHYQ